MAEKKHKRFKLSFVNAAEDVPRLIRAYGRACFGEFGLVLRPTEGRGTLVLLREGGAVVWRAGDGDSPKMPSEPMEAKAAVALLRDDQAKTPPLGPVTLRGQWSGAVVCDDGTPRVELERKLAAYGVLRIASTTEGAWTWKVERAEKWFAKAGTDAGSATNLVKAIEGGLARAMGLLGEACSMRDSRRRAAMDDGYAMEHPMRVPAEGRDPTAPMTAKAERGPKGRPRSSTKSRNGSAAGPGDAEKDRALLAAFQSAVVAAMSSTS